MPDPGQVRFLQQVKARCSSASSPGDRRAAISAGSDPSNGDLWSTAPEFHLTGPPRLYPPLPVSMDGKGEENIGIRQRLHPPRNRGKNRPPDAPQRAAAASRSGRMWALPSPPPPVIPTVSLCRCIKLAETHARYSGSHSHD